MHRAHPQPPSRLTITSRPVPLAKQNKKKMSLAKRKSSSAWTASESVALEAGVKAHGASEYPPLFKPEPPPIAAAWKRVPPADPPSPENG